MKKYNFTYCAHFGGGDWGDEIDYESEVSDEEYKILKELSDEGEYSLEDVEELGDLLKRLVAEIESIERECFDANEMWTEDDKEAYGTDNPFDVFDVHVYF